MLKELIRALMVATACSILSGCGAADPAEVAERCGNDGAATPATESIECEELGSSSSCPANFGGRYYVRCRQHSTLWADFKSKQPRSDCQLSELDEDTAKGVADGYYCCRTQP